MKTTSKILAIAMVVMMLLNSFAFAASEETITVYYESEWQDTYAQYKIPGIDIWEPIAFQGHDGPATYAFEIPAEAEAVRFLNYLAGQPVESIPEGECICYTFENPIDGKVYKKIKQYPLRIEGANVTDDNLSGDGWRFYPQKNILLLKDANIVAKDFETIGYSENDGVLNIVLLGENTIRNDNIYAINSSGGLVFTGLYGAKLDIISGEANIVATNDIIIDNVDMTLDVSDESEVFTSILSVTGGVQLQYSDIDFGDDGLGVTASQDIGIVESSIRGKCGDINRDVLNSISGGISINNSIIDSENYGTTVGAAGDIWISDSKINIVGNGDAAGITTRGADGLIACENSEFVIDNATHGISGRSMSATNSKFEIKNISNDGIFITKYDASFSFCDIKVSGKENSYMALSCSRDVSFIGSKFEDDGSFTSGIFVPGGKLLVENGSQIYVNGKGGNGINCNNIEINDSEIVAKGSNGAVSCYGELKTNYSDGYAFRYEEDGEFSSDEINLMNHIFGKQYFEIRNIEEFIPVWIDGTRFCKDNNYTIEGNEGGKAVYDPETKTLTLDGYSSSVADETGIYAEGELNLILKGTNKLSVATTDNADYPYDAIEAIGNIVIGGDGKLIIESGSVGIYSHSSVVIDGTPSIDIQAGNIGIASCKDIEINGGALNIEADAAGIDTDGDTEINGGALNIRAGFRLLDPDYESAIIHNGKARAIDTKGDITITGGKIDMESIDDALYVLGNLLITGGTIGAKAVADGIEVSKDATITGGTISIEAEEDGIDIGEDATITGGKIDIEANYSGIEVGRFKENESFGNLSVKGGSITIEAALADDGEYAITAFGGIEISSKLKTDGKIQSVRYADDNNEYDLYTLADNDGIPLTAATITVKTAGGTGGGGLVGSGTTSKPSTSTPSTAPSTTPITPIVPDASDANESAGEVAWKNPFADVKEDAWYYKDVEYAVSNGLFNGTGATTFAPDGLVTRAMLVTVLYRAEGEPATNRSIPFADINMGAYYASAVIWAQQNGIVNGVSETEFAPDASITREQIATIMFRYAAYKGMDAITMEENLHFDDAASISEYAITAMNWAVGRGLMNGKTANTINPKDTATRAEVAAILQRFMKTNG